MKIQVLGSGNAFTLKNYQTSFLINDHFLFDCGSDTRFALRDIGLSYKDIGGVFISHLHSDHIGGLEWLGFTKYFDPTQCRPNLFLSKVLEDQLWNDSLKGGMGSLQGLIADLATYFNVISLLNNSSFSIDDPIYRCQPVQTIHIMNGYYFVPSFGLMISTTKEKTVFFTGDTQYAPAQISDFYKKADVIFQDCEYFYVNGSPVMSKVHSHYEELKQLPEDIRSKMVLTHYQDSMLDVDVTHDGFRGKAIKGEIIEV